MSGLKVRSIFRPLKIAYASKGPSGRVRPTLGYQIVSKPSVTATQRNAQPIRFSREPKCFHHIAGCVGAVAGQHSPWFDWQQLIEADPEVLVLMPCGWDIARARTESAVLVSDPRWAQLSAVRAGKVFVTDGHQFLNRPGPRLLESAQILAEILHPDACNFGHRGLHWEKL